MADAAAGAFTAAEGDDASEKGFSASPDDNDADDHAGEGSGETPPLPLSLLPCQLGNCKLCSSAADACSTSSVVRLSRRLGVRLEESEGAEELEREGREERVTRPLVAGGPADKGGTAAAGAVTAGEYNEPPNS
jgi:hypothetical protein